MHLPRYLLFLCLFVPNLAAAAQIYGSVKAGDRPVGQGVSVQVTCAGNTVPYSGVTDNYGSYSINVRQTGSCTLRVQYNGKWTAPFQIYSENEPVRYDFALVQQGADMALQRR